MVLLRSRMCPPTSRSSHQNDANLPPSAKTDFPTDQRAHYAIVVLRLLFLTTLALTIAGVRMHAQKDSPDVVRIGQRLAEAGAIVSLALLGASFCGDVFLWCRCGRALERNSRKARVSRVCRLLSMSAC